MTAETLVGKAIELAAATLPRRKFTREEYYRLAEAGILREEERTELIEGEIVTMVPIGPEHATQTTGLRERVRRLVRQGLPCA
jgi:Uma2 family endonuclease